jgi:glycosyltransferase involved in cell wall biosynthesis
MVVHGADWYIPPYHKVYNRLDTMYIKAFMPLYFKKSDFVISVSDYSTRGYVQAMPRFKDKIGTIYFAPNRGFKRVEDPVVLETARAKYNLPEHFLLTVIRYDPGRKKHRKNFRNMVKGFARCREKYGIPHKWIVVGKNCEKYGEETDLAALGVEEDVIFPGYVEQEDLPALYTLADLYLYATIIEAFPIPITEAMSCGCPIVTSKGTGLEELAGEAARLVDPYDIDEIAENIYQVLGDADCQKRLTRNGLERAQLFDWEKCARETLEVFERCVDGKIASYAGN